MSAPINIDAYSDALVVLATAGVVVPLMRRLRVNPVLGYLAAGAILGPLGLGSFIESVPFLYWVTVVDAANVAGIAELGVVFLLFLIGLELSYERLEAMRRLVFGLGSLQVVVSAAVIGGVAMLAGQGPATAAIAGLCLALSSTAIVIELLSNQGRLATSTGRASFAVLLAQDLAVIPILVFISIMGTNSSESVLSSLLFALTNASLAIAGIIIIGRLFLRSLFRVVAASTSSDLFVAATLFVIIGTAVAGALAGLSMALGAFVAGLLLAETEFRKAIEAAIGPFKGLLLGLFFFTVGMGIDFREIAREPGLLLAAALGLIVVKALVLLALSRSFRLPWDASVETSLLLGTAGEFAFVGIGMAAGLGLLEARFSAFLLALTSITMAFSPALSMLGRRLSVRLLRHQALAPELLIPPETARRHAIVVGHGRVGQVVCTLLGQHGFSFVAVDSDADAVAQLRRGGRKVFYGDATSAEFLSSCGLADAAAVIVTIGVPVQIDEIVKQVRSVRPDILIVSRARDAVHARHLYAIGVSDAVPETIEASLQLSEAALVGLGLPAAPATESVHQMREEFQRSLREAAGSQG